MSAPDDLTLLEKISIATEKAVRDAEISPS